MKEFKNEKKYLKQYLTILKIEQNLLAWRRNKTTSSIGSSSEEEKHVSFNKKPIDNTPNKSENKELKKKKSVKIMRQLKINKWHTRLKIIINRDYGFDSIVLVDTGVDLIVSKKEWFPHKPMQVN